MLKKRKAASLSKARARKGTVSGAGVLMLAKLAQLRLIIAREFNL